MIEGVQLKQLTTHADERGFFREILRSTDEIFGDESFAQLSQSSMYSGTIKAWHWHRVQYDYWFVPIGVIKAVLCDIRNVSQTVEFLSGKYLDAPGGLAAISKYKFEFSEFLLGDNQPAQVLRIPPGVAHGLKVLQGPAHLFYVTSRVYDPEDEGRLAYDSLGYDWHKQEIT